MIYKMQRYGFIADFRLLTRKITAFFFHRLQASPKRVVIPY